VIQGTGGVRNTLPDSLEGAWQLVHVAGAYQQLGGGRSDSMRGVDAGAGPAGNGAASTAREGSAAGVPELLLEQLQQAVALLPGAELAGPVHQDVQSQARKPWTVSSTAQGLAFRPLPDSTLGTPDTALWQAAAPASGWGL